MRSRRRCGFGEWLLALAVVACTPPPHDPRAREPARNDPIEQATRCAMKREWNLALSIVRKARDGSSPEQHERLDALEANVLRLALGRKRQAQRGECDAAGLLQVETLGNGGAI
jgi:hypothetical protein